MLIYDLVERKIEVCKRGIRSLGVIRLEGPRIIFFAEDVEELLVKL